MKFSMFRRRTKRRRRRDENDDTDRNRIGDVMWTSTTTASGSDSDNSTRSRTRSSHSGRKNWYSNSQHERQIQEHLHRRRQPHGALRDINHDDAVARNNNSTEYTVAEVGQPPPRLLKKKERMSFKIYDFVNCDEQRGDYKITPTLKAHGYHWKLQIYPRGDNRSHQHAEYVSCFLHYFSNPNDKKPPIAKVEYHCGSHKTETQICTFEVEAGKCSTSWGLENFVRRERVLQEYLDDENALVIHVDVQLAVDRKVIWYPPPMRQEPTLMKLYQSSNETSDVSFSLGTGETRAHKIILALRSPILYELICQKMMEPDDLDESAMVRVDLPGIDEDVMEALLEHIYTVRQPSINDVECGKRLLVAADRFCIPNLKLYVESVLSDRFVTVETAAGLLLLADAHSCALLKETAMDCCVLEPNSVRMSPDWKLVEESTPIQEELKVHIHSSYRKCFHKNFPSQHKDKMNGINYDKRESEKDTPMELHGRQANLLHTIDNQMDIFSLREQLAEEGISVDGSREALVARWRELRNNT